MKIGHLRQEITANPLILIQAPLAFLFTGVMGNLAHLSIKLGYQDLIFYRIINSWSKALCVLLRIKIESSGCPQLKQERAYVFVANHQTWLDILIVAATLPPKTIWIAKKEIGQIPVIGRAIKAAGFLFTTRNQDCQEARLVIKQGVEKLRQGTSLFIFPEGTRSYAEKMRDFKSGAFHLAKTAPAAIVPIGLKTHHILAKGHFAPQPRKPAKIYFGEIIPLNQVAELTIPELKKLTQTRIVAIKP